MSNYGKCANCFKIREIESFESCGAVHYCECRAGLNTVLMNEYVCTTSKPSEDEYEKLIESNPQIVGYIRVRPIA